MIRGRPNESANEHHGEQGEEKQPKKPLASTESTAGQAASNGGQATANAHPKAIILSPKILLNISTRCRCCENESFAGRKKERPEGDGTTRRPARMGQDQSSPWAEREYGPPVKGKLLFFCQLDEGVPLESTFNHANGARALVHRKPGWLLSRVLLLERCSLCSCGDIVSVLQTAWRASTTLSPSSFNNRSSSTARSLALTVACAVRAFVPFHTFSSHFLLMLVWWFCFSGVELMGKASELHYYRDPEEEDSEVEFRDLFDLDTNKVLKDGLFLLPLRLKGACLPSPPFCRPFVESQWSFEFLC